MKGDSTDLFVSHIADTSLDHLRFLVPHDYSKDLFNDNGFVVRARTTTGEDFHIWMFMYRQRGDEMIIDNDVCQTLVVCGNYDAGEGKRLAISDAPYVNFGQNIDDYNKIGSLQTTESDTEVKWELAGRVFTGSPPNWRVSGTHAGVEVDFKFSQRGDAFYHCGRFEDLSASKEGMAGYVVHAHVTGTLTVKGKKMTIADGQGHGVHERIIFAGHIPPRIDYMGGRGHSWLHGWGDKMSFYIITGDVDENTSTATFMLNVDGATVVAQGEQNTWNEELDRWFDPKTNQLNPCKWRTTANTEQGRFEAKVTARGRGFYTWTRRRGQILVHQFVCDCVAKLTKKDGTVIEEKQVASLEYMRTLYNQKN